MDGATEPRQALGKLGERMAADFLRRRGYRIHECNYRCRYGELDIIASEEDVLVFVEVRSRRGSSYGSAEESVTPRKQQKLRQVANAYLQERYPEASGREQAATKKSRQSVSTGSTPPPLRPQRRGELPACRIDVVAIAFGRGGAVEHIELIRDAVGE